MVLAQAGSRRRHGRTTRCGGSALPHLSCSLACADETALQLSPDSTPPSSRDRPLPRATPPLAEQQHPRSHSCNKRSSTSSANSDSSQVFLLSPVESLPLTQWALTDWTKIRIRRPSRYGRFARWDSCPIPPKIGLPSLAAPGSAPGSSPIPRPRTPRLLLHLFRSRSRSRQSPPRKLSLPLSERLSGLTFPNCAGVDCCRPNGFACSWAR